MSKLVILDMDTGVTTRGDRRFLITLLDAQCQKCSSPTIASEANILARVRSGYTLINASVSENGAYLEDTLGVFSRLRAVPNTNITPVVVVAIYKDSKNEVQGYGVVDKNGVLSRVRKSTLLENCRKARREVGCVLVQNMIYRETDGTPQLAEYVTGAIPSFQMDEVAKPKTTSAPAKQESAVPKKDDTNEEPLDYVIDISSLVTSICTGDYFKSTDVDYKTIHKDISLIDYKGITRCLRARLTDLVSRETTKSRSSEYVCSELALRCLNNSLKWILAHRYAPDADAIQCTLEVLDSCYVTDEALPVVKEVFKTYHGRICPEFEAFKKVVPDNQLGRFTFCSLFNM